MLITLFFVNNFPIICFTCQIRQIPTLSLSISYLQNRQMLSYTLVIIFFFLCNTPSCFTFLISIISYLQNCQMLSYTLLRVK